MKLWVASLARPIYKVHSLTLSGSTFILYIMTISPMSSCISLPLSPLWLHLPGNDNPSLEMVFWYASPFIKLCIKNTEIRLTKTDRHRSYANRRQAWWRKGVENNTMTGVKNSSFSTFFSICFHLTMFVQGHNAVFTDIFVNIMKYFRNMINIKYL